MLRLVFLTFVSLIPATAPAVDHWEPYRTLRQANLTHNATLASSAYATDGRLIFEHPGRPAEIFEGREAIRSSYVRTFGQVDPGSPIEVQFRFDSAELTLDKQAGFYRIDASVSGQPAKIYGRFSVKLVKEQGAWRFAEDRSGPATQREFENLPVSEIFANGSPR